MVSATVETTPIATGTIQLPGNETGGYLSLSANGSTPGTGILWAVRPTYEAFTNIPQGVLRAFDAADVSRELWNSTQFEARDAVGNFAKFNVPTVANGKIYVASFSNKLDVYGIMGVPWVIIQPLSQAVNGRHSANLSVVVSGQGPLTYQWYWGDSGNTQNPVGTKGLGNN